jgi:hypothetical protein
MRAGRIVMAAASLLVGAVVLRAPSIRIGSRAARVGDAREESAYVLGAKAVGFPLPAGARTLRLLLNVDAAGAAGTPLPPVNVHVRMSPDGRDQIFPVLARDSDGAAVFYLDSARRPSRTAMLGLERALDAPGVLEVSVANAAPGGVVRLLNQERRALGSAERAWVALPAAAGSERRRIYFGPSSGVEAHAAVAESTPLSPGRAHAWTVTGPATVTVAVEEGELRGSLRLLNEEGTATERSLALLAGGQADVPVGPGLTTLTITSSFSARAFLSGPTSAAGALSRPAPLSAERSILIPRVTVVETVRCRGDASEPPVSFSVADRRAGAPLRIDVRAVVPDGAPAPPVVVRWRAVDGARKVLAEGRQEQPVRLAPEDRVVGSDEWLGEPSSMFVWAPAGATEVELVTDHAAELTALSAAWIDERDADGTEDGALPGRSVRLRHGPPPARRRYFPVAPSNRAFLAGEGRIDRLALSPRLELTPPPVQVAAESLVPAGDPPRFELLVPDRSSALLPTQVWAVPMGRDATFTSSGGAMNVLYAADPRDTSGAITVSLDGRRAAEGRLYSARGQLTMASLPGDHRIRIEGPPATRVFVNRPVARGTKYRRVAIYELPRGRSVHVRLKKAGSQHVVGVVLYGRGVVGGPARLVAQIDHGARQKVGAVSRQRTALSRGSPVVATSLERTVLLNTDVAPSWVSDPLFLRLGDDLGAGIHDIALSVRGISGPVFVRVFGHPTGTEKQDQALGPITWDLGT